LHVSSLPACQALRPFTRLSRASLEALRYRAEDVGRTITKGAVREARARELQRELLNSEKLSEYFEEHEAERVSVSFRE
jgi:ATP-dependent RNA helicase DDX56/DBP9